MDNVIDLNSQRAKRLDRRGTASERPTLFEQLRATTQISHKDRAILASRFGEISQQISPTSPKHGAKQLFAKAWAGEKWDKRKRLIRLPGEAQGSTGSYGEYEASGATWAALANSAALLLFPLSNHLESDRERVLRRVLRGTSLFPGSSELMARAEGIEEILSDLVASMKVRIKETGIERLWATLKVSPVYVSKKIDDQNDLQADRSADQIAKVLWGDKAVGYFDAEASYSESEPWPFPTVRIGYLQRAVSGEIFVPPPSMVPTIKTALNEDWGSHGKTGCQKRLIEWLQSGVQDEAYSPERGFGWREFSAKITRSIYLQACPDQNGNAAFWLKVKESVSDNCIPTLTNVDLPKLAYLNQTELHPYYEPFQFEEWTQDEGMREFMILICPPWAEGLCEDEGVAAEGIIGFVNETWLIDHRLSGEDRTPLWTADPPDWLGGALSFDWVTPGVGGWLDDPTDLDLQSLIFHGEPKTTFVPLLEGNDIEPVPAKRDTILEFLLRNALGEPRHRISRILEEQARTFTKFGLEHQEARIRGLRSKLSELED